MLEVKCLIKKKKYDTMCGCKMKTLKVSDKVHGDLTRLKGLFTAEKSETQTYDDVIKKLIDIYEKTNPVDINL
jgi:hypothetical protein